MDESTHKKISKNICLFLDGTWDSAIVGKERSTTTNVWRLSRAVEQESNGRVNTIFYQSGIGALGTILPNATEPAKNLVEGATGLGIGLKILEAYNFVAANYHRGDKIFIFGFSRGAYTARTLAALITDLGCLDRTDIEFFPEIYVAYQRRKFDPKAEQEVRKWELKADQNPVEIEFLGVWETVGSLGIPTEIWRFKKTFLLLGFKDKFLSPRINHACHAMGLKENRLDFDITKWEKRKGEQRRPDQTVNQTWFSGSHADIGGGWPEHDLSLITLYWMIQQVRHLTHLTFDKAYLDKIGTLNRARTPDGKSSYAYGAFPSHDPISQGNLSSSIFALANSNIRKVQLTPKADEYPEYIHESVQYQDVTTWPTSLQLAAKHEPKAPAGPIEQELIGRWDKIELVNSQTPPFSSWSTRLRALIHDVAHPFNHSNVRS